MSLGVRDLIDKLGKGPGFTMVALVALLLGDLLLYLDKEAAGVALVAGAVLGPFFAGGWLKARATANGNGGAK